MWRYQPNAEEEYVGNFWGWKFSLFGLALIVVMLGLAMVVAKSRGKSIFDNGGSSNTEPIETPAQ